MRKMIDLCWVCYLPARQCTSAGQSALWNGSRLHLYNQTYQESKYKLGSFTKIWVNVEQRVYQWCEHLVQVHTAGHFSAVNKTHKKSLTNVLLYFCERWKQTGIQMHQKFANYDLVFHNLGRVQAVTHFKWSGKYNKHFVANCELICLYCSPNMTKLWTPTEVKIF